MSPRPFTRRAFLALLGVTPLAGCIVGGHPPLPFERVRAIDVDTAPLAARGLPTWAGKITAALRPALARAFADALAPNDSKAPAIRVVVERVWLAAAPVDLELVRDGTVRDEMVGRLLVPATAGLPAFDRPIRALRSPTDAGPWYLPDIDDRRLDALADLFAILVRRELAS